MLRPTAISVTVQQEYKLKIIFNNGEAKIFDVKPYIKGSQYSHLKDISYFALVKTDGFTVIWPEGQDICPDELYYNSVPAQGDELTMKKIVSLGFDEARAEAKAEEKFATVKRMLKRGKSSLAEIAEDTDLPLDTIKKIQAEMQAI